MATKIVGVGDLADAGRSLHEAEALRARKEASLIAICRVHHTQDVEAILRAARAVAQAHTDVLNAGDALTEAVVSFMGRGVATESLHTMARLWLTEAAKNGEGQRIYDIYDTAKVKR